MPGPRVKSFEHLQQDVCHKKRWGGGGVQRLCLETASVGRGWVLLPHKPVGHTHGSQALRETETGGAGWPSDPVALAYHQALAHVPALYGMPSSQCPHDHSPSPIRASSVVFSGPTL